MAGRVEFWHRKVKRIVGLNKIDEGGLLKREPVLGDLVWQDTLPKNFDEADWR